MPEDGTREGKGNRSLTDKTDKSQLTLKEWNGWNLGTENPGLRHTRVYSGLPRFWFHHSKVPTFILVKLFTRYSTSVRRTVSNDRTVEQQNLQLYPQVYPIFGERSHRGPKGGGGGSDLCRGKKGISLGVSACGGGGLVPSYGDDATGQPQKTSGDPQQPGMMAGMLSSCSNGPGWLHVVADHSAAAHVARWAARGLPTS